MIHDLDTLVWIFVMVIVIGFFAPIVAGVGFGARRDTASRARLLTVLINCLLVALAALVPIGFTRLQLSGEIVYSISAAVYLVFIGVACLYFNRILKKTGPSVWEKEKRNFPKPLIKVLNRTVRIVLVFCLLPLSPNYNAALYLTALLLNFSQAALYFYRLSDYPVSMNRKRR